MNGEVVPTDALFLLDRNVVALIKDVVAGRVQTDPKKQAYLEALRALDLPTHSMSPLPSIIEGEKGLEDSAPEKAATLQKEALAVRQFFTRASTDADQLLSSKDTVASLFTGLRESQWDERAAFVLTAAPLLTQKVAANRRRSVEDELVRLAHLNGLGANDAIVMLCLACLYGSDAARGVLKPAKPNVHNVLSDLHALTRVGMVKAVARQLLLPVRVRLLTRDEALFDVLKHIRIVRPEVRADSSVEMQVAYSPALFPELSIAEARSMMQRVGFAP
ncbi:hypothetical protein [Paraburkholderia sp. J8-2]|uniref:hypothetical protein n=1 Tax=Paraburkholderia sp. J8-2 TaxID=2805440 RepID=UPI002AB71BBA|nr:hypothetical protein [Paraburkholderia sp. J8-2]